MLIFDINSNKAEIRQLDVLSYVLRKKEKENCSLHGGRCCDIVMMSCLPANSFIPR